jgi:hypothetical protein
MDNLEISGMKSSFYGFWKFRFFRFSVHRTVVNVLSSYMSYKLLQELLHMRGIIVHYLEVVLGFYLKLS